jgi:hypothetical protein
MELVNTNDENSFDPTPRLKSSPIPIEFIPFNIQDTNCIYCGEEYIDALFCSWQKYCKKCLSRYINDITDNNIYLDVYIYTTDLECTEHKISSTKVPQSIQECCENCLKILFFKQMHMDRFFDNLGPGHNYDPTIYNNVIKSERDCKLCGKSLSYIPKKYYYRILCSDCYLISSELTESTLAKKEISILYLPWWHVISRCDACNSCLIFTSDCQKYCAYCYIFYVGCRYCLTTNIIFGPIVQSQCRKCKKISLIINSSIKSDIDGFRNNIVFDNLDKLKISLNPTNIVKYRRNYFKPGTILDRIVKQQIGGNAIKWIPSYSQFKDAEEITKGGYGTIYKATWLISQDEYSNNNQTVILKRFENSKNIGKYFLNEVNILNVLFINLFYKFNFLVI